MSLYPALRNPIVVGPKWWVVDAHSHRVGRLATQIARLLSGKYKPSWNPSVDCGDYVVVINSRNVEFTGRKWEDKYYRWHTGWVGHLRAVKAKDLHKEKPEEVLRKAVLGMLPKNTTRRKHEKRLLIYPDEIHPHDDVPIEEFIPFRTKHEFKPPIYNPNIHDRIELEITESENNDYSIKLKETKSSRKRVPENLEPEWAQGQIPPGFIPLGEPISYQELKYIKKLMAEGYDGKDWPVSPENSSKELREYVERKLEELKQIRETPSPKPELKVAYPTREDVEELRKQGKLK